MENGFLHLSSPALLPPIFLHPFVQFRLLLREVALYACDRSYISQNKTQGTAPGSTSLYFILKRPIPPTAICPDCSILILYSPLPVIILILAYHNKWLPR